MGINTLHGWNISTSEAIQIQKKLSAQVLRKGNLTGVSCVAGVDISVKRDRKTATAAAVLLEYPSLDLAEFQTAEGEMEFPYVPGLLSFREIPLTLAAIEKLTVTPDLVIVDGQGIAHPRRIGLASHLGLFLDIPTIGCAKSRLCGEYTGPGDEPGEYSHLTDKDEIIGAVLRTKRGVKPVYVSVGHKTDLQEAVHWVMNCCKGYRLPETSRLAHLAAGGNLTAGRTRNSGERKPAVIR
jgi:deoxyribonuclease V